jgi:hypothetical protein
VSFGIHRLPAAALILAAGIALPAAAQAPGLLSPEARSRELQAMEQRAARDAARPNQEARASAEKRQREFDVLMADFAKSWNKLIQVAGRGGWNAKEARKTREAFERLVRCQAWIEAGKASAAGEIAARPN